MWLYQVAGFPSLKHVCIIQDRDDTDRTDRQRDQNFEELNP